MLRDAPLNLGGEVAEQRVIFEEMMAAVPVPADVATCSGSLSGIDTRLNSGGAEFLMLGQLLIAGIEAHKA